MLFRVAEQKNEKKREMAKRLVEMNARKREERLTEDRQQLEKLINIRKCYERGEMKDFQKQLRQNLLSNREELEVITKSVCCFSHTMLNDFFYHFFYRKRFRR